MTETTRGAMSHDTFGSYRSLLAKPPSAEVFRALVDSVMFERHPDLNHYVADHIARWPDHIPRPVTEALLAFTAEGELDNEAVWSLCTTLELYGQAGCTDMDAVCDVLASPLSGALHTLRVYPGTYEVDESVEVLNALSRPGAPSHTWRHLAFPYLDYIPEVIEELTTLDLSALDALDLRYCDLRDYHMEWLSWGLTPSLRTLRLQANGLCGPGMTTLCASDDLSALRYLDLRYNAIGPDGAEALANTPSLRGLEWLAVHREDVEEAGAKALAESPYLSDTIRRVWRARR